MYDRVSPKWHTATLEYCPVLHRIVGAAFGNPWARRRTIDMLERALSLAVRRETGDLV